MDSLGVRVIVGSQDCAAALCVDEALPGLTHCRRHASIAEIRAAREASPSNGLAALEAMDRGEPQPAFKSHAETHEEEEPMPVAEPNGDAPVHAIGMQKAPKWTRANTVAAIQAFAGRHKRPPRNADRTARNGLPPQGQPSGHVWSDLVEEAGFPRPARGGVKGSGRAAAKPPAPVERDAHPDPGPAPSRELEPVATGSGLEPAARPDEPSLLASTIANLDAFRAEAERFDEISIDAACKRDAILRLVEALESLS